jgi:hypothetical protein
VAGVSTGIHDEVDMVRHQAVGMDLEPERLAAFAQGGQVVAAVEVAAEHRIAAVTALHDVVWVSGECDP